MPCLASRARSHASLEHADRFHLLGTSGLDRLGHYLVSLAAGRSHGDSERPDQGNKRRGQLSTYQDDRPEDEATTLAGIDSKYLVRWEDKPLQHDVAT